MGSRYVERLSIDNERVYAEMDRAQEDFYAHEGIDAITGNALFRDKVVVIDYRNGKFGMR